jgi:hypothetical protein
VDTSENNRGSSQQTEKRSYFRKEELENMILSTCNTDFKTLEELAASIAILVDSSTMKIQQPK